MTLTRFLLAWRTTPLHDREVIDALVDPAHAAPSPALLAELGSWPGTYYWSDEPDGRHVVLTRLTAVQARERWVLHGFLFIATLFTTTLVGAVIANALPADLGIMSPETWFGGNWNFLRAWVQGLSFSVPLLAILLCHELGHYLTARRYQLNVSPPYFLPAPLGIGTFGAFIRLRTILTDRRQLLEVGAAGPIAGFIVALPVLWYGMAHSQPFAEGDVSGMFFMQAGHPWLLGDSLITMLVRHLTLGDVTAVALHPTAIAGWFGMFVTLLNLLPMAQLDGGHILYSAFPRYHRRVGQASVLLVLVMGYFSATWLIWGVVVLLLSRGQLAHPPVLDAYRPLPKSRRWLLWASLLLLVLTFSPVPLP